MWSDALVVAGCRLLLAGVFLMAGAGKLHALYRFTDRLVLAGFPAGWSGAAGAFLAWLELTCGLCLALGLAAREAAGLLAVQLVGYTLFLVLRPDTGDCGCVLIPGLQGLAWPVPLTLLRNVILVACCVAVVVGPRTRR